MAGIRTIVRTREALRGTVTGHAPTPTTRILPRMPPTEDPMADDRGARSSLRAPDPRFVHGL
jgi:hypothetical protein